MDLSLQVKSKYSPHELDVKALMQPHALDELAYSNTLNKVLNMEPPRGIK